jgi:uncharacterized membrane protein
MTGSGSSTATETERWEAATVLMLVLTLQVLLALLSETHGWKLWYLPWWVWLFLIGPEVTLMAMVWLGDDAHSVALAIGMSAVNALLLTALIGSIASGHEHSGGQLLLKGVTVWATNVTAFGLLFWELAHRRRRERRQFRFPQEETPGSHWKPSFFDYFYVSFTNSIAFSPTDAMPMTKRAKLLMLAESAVSAIAILLVASRAVNIFK